MTTAYVLFYGGSVLAASLLFVPVIKSTFFNHRRLSAVAKKFYNYFYSIPGINHLRINNWGYVPVDEELNSYAPELKYGLQLYLELVRQETGFLIPPKASIVEIGCGKGAGAEFLVSRFHPLSYTGIDYSSTAIDYCSAEYRHLPNAQFICADVHQMPIGSESTDIVVSVESSHVYKDLQAVFSEVYRVLKPGGKLLITDFRVIKNSPLEETEKAILNCGFAFIEKKMISHEVHTACLHSTAWRKRLVQKASPWLLRSFFYHYCVLEGTEKFRKLGNGEIVYFMYRVEKPVRSM